MVIADPFLIGTGLGMPRVLAASAARRIRSAETTQADPQRIM